MNRFNHRWIWLSWLLVIFVISNVTATETEIKQDEARSPEDNQGLILEFNRSSGMLAESDLTPRLRLYNNGRMVIHFPAYMKKAGTYETYLNFDQLEPLLEKLVTLGLLDFNQEQVVAEKQSFQSDDPVLFAVSDDTETRLWFDRGAFSSLLGFSSSDASPQVIVWRNVHSDARRYQNLQALQNLAESERLLLQFIDEQMASQPRRIR